jgi:fibronectin-binding autotransporter adhesin
MNRQSLRRAVALFLKVPTLSILLWTATPALSQMTSTWTGGAGNWQPCPQQNGTALWNTCPYYPGDGENNDTAIIQGGPVTANGGQVIANLGVAAGDTLIVTPGYVDISGSGTITNNGTISIGVGDGINLTGTGASVTLTGGGILIIGPNAGIQASPGTDAKLINQSTIEGQGQGTLGLGETAVDNQGVINAISGTLSVGPTSMTNTGTMEASSGGTLAFANGTEVAYNNTGGTIQALSGGIVQLEDGTYTGGTLTTTGTGVIQLYSDAILNNLTNTGTLQLSDNTALLEGTVTNNGTINVQSSADLFMSGNVTLTGSGSLNLASSGDLEANFTSVGLSGGTLTNKQLIQGSGEIYALPLTNQGTISANSKGNTLALVNGATTNTATLEASSGGTLEISTTINNTGGTIEASTGSTVDLIGTVSGGKLTTSGTGTIQSQNGTLDGTVNIPTNTGTLDVNGYNLTFEGTINNTGTIALSHDACIAIDQPSTLTGLGKLTMVANTCIYGSGIAFTNQSTIEGAGSVGDSNPMPITNTGTILANSSTPLTVYSGSYGFTNNGTLTVKSKSTLNVEGVFNNLSSAGTLAGGTYNVAGTLELPGGIASNATNLTLTGASAEIFNNITSTNALAGLSSNATTGKLTLASGQSLATTTAFTNSGKATVESTSSLTVGSRYTQTEGTTTVDGMITAPSGMTLEKGSLLGKGTVVAAVTSSGAAVIAGDSSSKPGTLRVTGSYTQQSKGTMDIYIGGTAAGTFGDLAVSNGVSLGGTLTIKLVNGFVPAVGDSFTILTGSSRSGTFATVNGTSINSGEHFEVNYTSTAVTLTVVSGA